MSDPQGLAFVHPDFDRDEGRTGLSISASGKLEWITGEGDVRQALLLLLSTRPGERAMRPDYGCDLHRLAFEPNDDTTAGMAIHHVRRAIERWEPRVEIVHLDATRDADDPGSLALTLRYRVRFLAQTTTLRWSISLSDSAEAP